MTNSQGDADFSLQLIVNTVVALFQIHFQSMHVIFPSPAIYCFIFKAKVWCYLLYLSFLLFHFQNFYLPPSLPAGVGEDGKIWEMVALGVIAFWVCCPSYLAQVVKCSSSKRHGDGVRVSVGTVLGLFVYSFLEQFFVLKNTKTLNLENR